MTLQKGISEAIVPEGGTGILKWVDKGEQGFMRQRKERGISRPKLPPHNLETAVWQDRSTGKSGGEE